MARNDKNLTLENIRIAYRNFAGKENTYNRAGDRNFVILLDEELAEQMAINGWNVKHLKAREEGDPPQAYIQVAISYKSRPPKIVMITSRGLTYLPEEMLDTLDWVDIETADVILNPYEWSVGAKTGVKAYVHSLFIKIDEDYLEEKWTAWAENNQKALPVAPDYIDAEVLDEPLQIRG
jgi:hypothetical protein